VSELIKEIAAQRVIPVIRSADAGDAVETARACGLAGMRIVELTQTIPDLDEALEELREDDLIVGVGTITKLEQVQAAARRGSSFVVSFAAHEAMIRTAREAGLIAIPGALTPTEVLHCVSAGAPAVKLFPASAVSPSYLRDLLVLIPGLRVMATGGLKASPGELEPWFEAGAWAIGLGSDLGSAAELGPDGVKRRARAVLDIAAGSAKT
jgi:2-dehydro-3-deoxyphosphogluconate aldolase/(4S)-4-hydroxy-2-oxoglutarate aldolase